MGAWSKGHSTARVCLTCFGKADCRPLPGCTEERHWHRFEVKLERNNEYRRQRRAAAREAGTVDRTGRGNAANKTAYSQRRHAEIRDVLFERLGQDACVRCGYSDKRALQFDHIDGGGRRHRLSLPSGSAYYRALVAMSPDELRSTFQVLCANCNAVKRHEREEWRQASSTTAQTDEGLPPPV